MRENKGNFYAILYINNKSLQMHVSYHASGVRHFKLGPKGETPQRHYPSSCQAPSALRGTEVILGATILRGQFQKLRAHTAPDDRDIWLDADAAHFRDDVIFVRVFLMEPGSDASIPMAFGSGPPLLHVIKETRPWVGIAFFQQRELPLPHNGVVWINSQPSEG